MEILLEYLAKRFLNNPNLDDAESRTTVAAVAGVIDAVMGNDDVRKTHLINWCTASSGAGLGDAAGIRRAVVAVLARDKEAVSTVLEKSLAQFGDQLYIKHAAMLQQEGEPGLEERLGRLGGPLTSSQFTPRCSCSALDTWPGSPPSS